MRLRSLGSSAFAALENSVSQAGRARLSVFPAVGSRSRVGTSGRAPMCPGRGSEWRKVAGRGLRASGRQGHTRGDGGEEVAMGGGGVG